MSRYSRYEAGTPSRSNSSSYCLPAKYGGEVTTRATEPSVTWAMLRASPQTKGLGHRLGDEHGVVVGQLGVLKRS